MNLAKTLGQSLTELPGAHTGYATRATDFVAMLLDLFARMEAESPLSTKAATDSRARDSAVWSEV